MCLRRYVRIIAATLALTTVYVTAEVSAQQAQSNNYTVNEVYFGPGGQLRNPNGEGCSATDGNGDGVTYCADISAGDTAAGRTNSTGYNAIAGGETSRNEYLEVAVSQTSRDLGTLTPSSASTTTTSFSVKSYLASGYVVRTVSDPPRNGSYTLPGMSSPAGSTPGTAQFGINLKDNSSPDVGAEVSHSPDSTFGYGAAATGYNTANQFKYVKNDVIASSPSSSGTTTFTISYLFNINSLTPAGFYLFQQDIVATSTY